MAYRSTQAMELFSQGKALNAAYRVAYKLAYNLPVRSQYAIGTQPKSCENRHKKRGDSAT